MTQPPKLFDRRALAGNRARSAIAPASFLQERAAEQVKERLEEVNRTFSRPLVVGGMSGVWSEFGPNCEDAEHLHFDAADHDLIIHAFGLHWSDDPVGQLIQCRRALRPDGMFIGVMYGGRTLHELRAALTEAESSVSGGLSPRVSPMADIRDVGSLLQRSGYALPVVDSEQTTVEYGSLSDLMHDLRQMGEANALEERPRRFSPRSLFEIAERVYFRDFSVSSDRIPATFETFFLTGWAPSPQQQQPLRPGSAKRRLANELGVREWGLESD